MDGEDVFIERHGLAGEQLIEVMAGLRVGGANVDIVCDLGGFGLGENTLPPVHRLEGEKLFNAGTGLLWWTCGSPLRLGGRDFVILDDV